MSDQKTTPVRVDRELHKRAKAFSTRTGMPLSRVLQEAITQYLDTTGEAVVEVLSANAATA